MTRFYFDVRANDKLDSDLDGLELKGLEFAKNEAVKVLCDLAREALPAAPRHKLSVDVRNGEGNLVFRTMLVFAVKQYA
jgi:hypothetical protein